MIPQSGLPKLFPRLFSGQKQARQLSSVLRSDHPSSREIREGIKKWPVQGSL